MFKYKVGITVTNTSPEIEEKLNNLGYTILDYGRKYIDGHYILTGSNIHHADKYGYYTFPYTQREKTYQIENEEAFLAIAAIKSDDEFHAGEILKVVEKIDDFEDVDSLLENSYIKITSKSTQKPENFICNRDNITYFGYESLPDAKIKRHFTSDSDMNKGLLVKATPQEIIEFYKTKEKPKEMEFKVGDKVRVKSMKGITTQMSKFRIGNESIIKVVDDNTLKLENGAAAPWVNKEDVELIDNKKIIGYKAPMDMYKNLNFTKGIKKDDAIYPAGTNTWKTKADPSNSFYIPEEIVKTWEPVYEEEIKEEVLTLGTSKIKITISKGKIEAEGKSIDIQVIKRLTSLMDTPRNNGDYKMPWAISIDTVDIGCSEFSLKELKTIEDTYRKLN